MKEKRRQTLIYYGKRDDALWEAIQRLPKGDLNYEIKQAMKAYFLGERAAFTPPPPHEDAETTEMVGEHVEEPNPTRKIDMTKLGGGLIG